MDHVTDIEHALPDTMSYEDETDPVVLVEVCQKNSSTVRRGGVRGHVTKLLQQNYCVDGELRITDFDDSFLKEHVHSVVVTCDSEQSKPVDLAKAKFDIHVYQLHEDGPGSEELEEDDLSAAQHWLMPCTEFEGIWESLVFDAHIKHELLQYVKTTLLFSDRKVDCNVISWNRVVLLHGPPGTGKTSLCKALAQKLCIQLSNRYSYGQLIEINSHSLFSKWFSESGKLVMKMFQKIQELIDDQDALVCVLIDEVESLTAARKSSLSGNEPSDAIRVVNALLTQIDQIKRNSNVIILTTSNVTGAIDLAFVDRADIKQYIGPPSTAAIYKIYQSCIKELMRANIISPAEQVFDLKSLELIQFTENAATQASLCLRKIAIKSQSLSGRTLRKLPFLAHAVFIQKPSVRLTEFLAALDKAVDKQFEDRHQLTMD